MDPIRFDTSPDRYSRWKLTFDGPVATLAMNVPEDGALAGDYVLKLNSYDLGVDIELADSIQRIRFEHPEVKALVVTSLKDGIFCSGANIYMLGSSSHAFKVNFCKYTNETRLYLETLSAQTGVPSIAALNGTASGGGYELAMACDHILLQDDGNTAVSLPEVPLLGVLPGTGGLTRLVDKRKVRRDLADAFSTVAEGVRGKRAVQWRLVDEIAPRSKFDDAVKAASTRLAQGRAEREGPGVKLPPLEPTRDGDVTRYRHVTLAVDRKRRLATLTVAGPTEAPPADASALRIQGADAWSLRAMRELDAALLDLRFNHLDIGVIALKTSGEPATVLAHDARLLALAERDWFAREVLWHMARVLKRLDLSARTAFAFIEPGSCFAGSLFELALAADRSYMLDVSGGPTVALSALSFGALPMSNGLSRLATRFLATPEHVDELRGQEGPIAADRALELGLVTYAPDDLDWDDEVRIAIEERAAFSPDALTGMEASLRFAGPETMETKIFGRLSAWQNWIFQRPNAVGEKGALTLYGSPERPVFDYRRT
ncbi:MAG: 2,3-epoxybenzoyl-CoA dihydrolase [Polyangiaceae bacterium]|nr:2,3-epoxybenzoyl-CoA dihydrolase [Polyangiaceae bacterium]